MNYYISQQLLCTSLFSVHPGRATHCHPGYQYIAPTRNTLCVAILAALIYALSITFDTRTMKLHQAVVYG